MSDFAAVAAEAAALQKKVSAHMVPKLDEVLAWLKSPMVAQLVAEAKAHIEAMHAGNARSMLLNIVQNIDTAGQVTATDRNNHAQAAA